MCLEQLIFAYSWAIILGFISKVITILFSPEAGITNVHFVHLMSSKNTKHNIPKNAGNTVQCRVLVVYPCYHMADWELQPTATAQCHESVVWHIARSGKDQNSKFEVLFALNAYYFCIHIESWTIGSRIVCT